MLRVVLGKLGCLTAELDNTLIRGLANNHRNHSHLSIGAKRRFYSSHGIDPLKEASPFVESLSHLKFADHSLVVCASEDTEVEKHFR